MLWSLWLAHNATNFVGKKYSPLEVFHRLKASMGSVKAHPFKRPPRIPPTQREEKDQSKADSTKPPTTIQVKVVLGVVTTTGWSEDNLQAWRRPRH